MGKGTWEGLNIPSYVTITLITRAHLSTANKSPYVLVKKKCKKKICLPKRCLLQRRVMSQSLRGVGIKRKKFLQWISDYIRRCYIITNTRNKAKLKNPTPNTPPPPSPSKPCVRAGMKNLFKGYWTANTPSPQKTNNP